MTYRTYEMRSRPAKVAKRMLLLTQDAIKARRLLVASLPVLTDEITLE